MVITSGAPETLPVPWEVIPPVEPGLEEAIGVALRTVAAV
jgi:hypothetical protein